MPAYKLVIAPAAKNDLKDIYQYGLRQWRHAQSDSFLSAIKEQFWSLTAQPLIGIERPELLPHTRSLSMQSHTLFYRVDANQVKIIRGLHGRQDVLHHLK
jgi:toxin ParE1/3/4